MNNIFNYVMRDEATERKLIDGMNCMPETALEEFKFIKENCTSHRVDEADLDRLIREELISARCQLRKAYAGIEDDVK